MDTFTASLDAALALLLHADAHLYGIVSLSLRVSCLAVLLAALFALPLGALLAVAQFPGRRTLTVLVNGFMGLPAVVVGLIVYLSLSRAGPLGELGLLFTPSAMSLAQAVLVAPLLAALTRQIVEDAWFEYADQLHSLGVSPRQAALTLLWDTRWSLSTVLLAGFGRAISEVGAVMIVGGNIDGVTRVMTTAIALETSKGDLPLAMGLGIILVALVLLLNALAQAIRSWAARSAQ
ncbi:MAG: ABC transporter permease [Rhodocyclaceae bacterium]|nr:ABC transporter permease [Rhodocyclaceae bacterium]